MRGSRYIFVHVLVGLLAINMVGADTEEHNATWDLRKWFCKIKGNKALVTIHGRLTVLNPRGDDYAEWTFLEDRFHKIKRLSISVKDDNGETIASYSKRDLNKVCGFGQGYDVYTDICYYHFTPSSPRYPYIVEYEYQQELKSLFRLRGFQVVSQLPVKHALCELVAPDNLVIHWKTYGVDLSFREDTEKGRRFYTWEANDIPPVNKDSLSTVEATRAGRIVMIADGFSFAGKSFNGCTWRNVGQWYADVARDSYDRAESTPDKAPGWLESTPARTKAAYDRIRDELRYVSVSIGVSGWRPRKAENTRATRYGDCKDLSTLLISTLDRQGIVAYPALVLTRDEGRIDTTFPDFGFNHVIVAGIVGRDTVWMDPTCNVCSFGELPWGDEGTFALLVTDTGGIIVPTPMSSRHDNVTNRYVRIKIDQSFHLQATGHLSITGLSAHYLRRVLPSLGTRERRTLVEKMIGSSGTRYAIDKCNFKAIEQVDDPLELDFHASIENPLRVINGVVYLDPIMFTTGLGYRVSDLQDRIRPAPIRYARTFRDSVIVVWDTNLVFEKLEIPSCDTVSHSFADWTLSAIAYEDSALVLASYSYKVLEIPPEDFDDLLQFEEMLRNRGAQQLKYVVPSGR